MERVPHVWGLLAAEGQRKGLAHEAQYRELGW